MFGKLFRTVVVLTLHTRAALPLQSFNLQPLGLKTRLSARLERPGTSTLLVSV